MINFYGVRFRPRMTPSALQRGFSFSPPPPAFFRSRAFSGFRLFRVFRGRDAFPEPFGGVAAGLLLSACGSADAVSGETGRRMPFGGVRPRRAERDVSAPAGRIARRREYRMPRACKARGIGIRGERVVSAPQGGKRRCRRSWRVWG